jgi:hypothetical protein
MSAHPLTTFVYETFGQQFGALLLAGYGEESPAGSKVFHYSDTEAVGQVEWAVELIADRLPYRDEPLVLAALLKLLLTRPTISEVLDFEADELMAELQWGTDAEAYKRLHQVIRKYVSLVYDKQEQARAGGLKRTNAPWGCYHLLLAHLRETVRDEAAHTVKRYSRVSFDYDFARGLKRGRVYFAGIDFGTLHLAGDRG